MKPRQPNARELEQRAKLAERLAGRARSPVDIDEFCPPHLPEDREPPTAQTKPAPVLADEIERLRLLTFCGCGGQFSAHDPGACGACVAGMTCKPAPVLLTDVESHQLTSGCFKNGWISIPLYAREIEAAVLKKNGIGA